MIFPGVSCLIPGMPAISAREGANVVQGRIVETRGTGQIRNDRHQDGDPRLFKVQPVASSMEADFRWNFLRWIIVALVMEETSLPPFVLHAQLPPHVRLSRAIRESRALSPIAE